MKKKTRGILILAIALVLSAVPMLSFAYAPTVIERVDISVEAPVCGDNAYANYEAVMNFTISADSHVVAEDSYEEFFVEWLYPNGHWLEWEDVFKGGNTYGVFFPLEPEEDYIFDDNTKFYINGQEAFVHDERYEDFVCIEIPSLFKAVHKISKVKDYKAPTCTAAGNIAYYKCSSCNKLFKDAAGNSTVNQAGTVIKATGHKWDGGVVTKAPTATEPGVRTYTCQNDPSHTRTEVIPATAGKEGSVKKMGRDKSAGTGDEENPYAYMMLAIASFALILMAGRRYGDENKVSIDNYSNR